jgi:hypothetical protein
MEVLQQNLEADTTQVDAIVFILLSNSTGIITHKQSSLKFIMHVSLINI